MRDVRRSGRSFPEKGCILEHQICKFAKMILRDRCSTSYDLASFLMLSSLKNEEFWQNCFVFDVVELDLKHEEVSRNCFIFDVVKFKN